MNPSGNLSSNISDDSDNEEDQNKFTNREINSNRDIRNSSSSIGNGGISYFQGPYNTENIEYNNGTDQMNEVNLVNNNRLSINTNDETSYHMIHPRSPNRTGNTIFNNFNLKKVYIFIYF
jgi:hypothetical protein